MRHKKPENWLAAVAKSSHGISEQRVLGTREQAAEAMLMGLRLAEGVTAERFLARTGCTLESAIDAEALRRASEEGYVIWHDGRLNATPEGRRRLDALLPFLVT